MRATDRRRLRRGRLAAQGLHPALGTAAGPATALSVVQRLGALQAQDYGSGAWSLGVRAGITRAQVEQAVHDREIVRTWPMRGTIHWVPAADARWMCRLLAAPRSTALATRYAQLGITERDIEASGALVETHLQTPVSRPDLLSMLADSGVDPSGQRAYHLIAHHCMTGLLCQGPLIGRQPSFVLIDAWVPGSLVPSREEGLAVIVERYLRGHGPVTEKDLAGWLLKPLGLVREALALLGDDVLREELDGVTWLRHADAEPVPDGLAGVHLLPQWDELLLGYKSRDVVLDPADADRVVPSRNMVFRPSLVVDGQVRGVWRRREGRGRAVVDVEAFAPVSKRVRALLDGAAAAHGHFLGLDVDLRLSVGA
ncbi:MAG: winged helix DNA-binding domain-containing protein [Terracoccus sp.]